MMRNIEDNPDNDGGFNVEIGDKNLKKNSAKTRQFHTRSQIFKYACGQIEKEEAMHEQTQDMTFSGVISIATDMNIMSRPPIEVAADHEEWGFNTGHWLFSYFFTPRRFGPSATETHMKLAGRWLFSYFFMLLVYSLHFRRMIVT